MSIKLMSAIWDTEIGDLQCSKTVHHKDGTEEHVNYITKGSTSKSVLLAIADHANDYGQGSFPGLRLLEKKTEYSRVTIIDTISTLRAYGILSVAEEPSMLGTNDYTINIRCFPKMAEEAARLPDPVKPLNQQSEGGKATLPDVVKPLYHNHPLIIDNNKKENNQIEEPATPSNFTEQQIALNLQKLMKLRNDNLPGMLTPIMADELRDAAATFPGEWYEEAFRAAVLSEARNWRYIRAILQNRLDGKEYKPQTSVLQKQQKNKYAPTPKINHAKPETVKGVFITD